ncbi:MAG TPA: lactate racemase domain-containing protein [Bryobacteraceae bacterium]|nr:lactate racemase domain-containing protein [Bryobacteraceae bacterium]
MDFSPLMLVRQHFPDRAIKDIHGEVHKQLNDARFGSELQPGSRVAIGVGSRGIANLSTIVKSVVDYWKGKGVQPFLFPAMGSHGAATAEGQADVLRHYGIDERSMGCPVLSQLEVVSLGQTPQGIEAFMDRLAYESDGVMLIGRVKWHTDFAGKIESGLFKMMAIGLGKFAGAQRYHTYAYRLGLETVIRAVGRQVLGSGKILGGLAILEDANHTTAQLTAVRVEEMEQREEELLALVKSWMARIPVPLDILILDEIGKNFSGAGMDTKVVNRSVNGEYNPWDTAPHFSRLFIRGISDLSYRNGVGLGMADVVHDRLVSAIDWTPTQINSLTASTPAAIRTPIHFSTDRTCLEKIAPTVGKLDVGEVTLGWIRNSLDLRYVGLSDNLRPMVEGVSGVEIIGSAQPWPFDAKGDLPKYLPIPEQAASSGH